MMDWYGSNTVAEKKAPEYPFKMSTWAKIKKNYLDDNSDQMSPKKCRDYLSHKEKLWLIQYF